MKMEKEKAPEVGKRDDDVTIEDLVRKGVLPGSTR